MLPANGFGRSDVCSGCTKETRVCLNCRFHDPGSYNECRETVAERIVDKDRANFCDFFKSKGSLPRNENIRMSGRNNGSGNNANSNSNNKSSRNTGGSNAAWAAAEALFKRN
ncbi:MAG: hypothetical protein HQM00_13915 [Magnetococcales bacterium]|jgi:hypothetical protein|nr:hypothetical protein [Magnetococcales bacterium]